MNTDRRDCQPPSPENPSGLAAREIQPSSHSAKHEPAACCPPAPESTGPSESTCCTDSAEEVPGYRLCSFVCAWRQTPVGKVPQVSNRLQARDIVGRWQMRWGLGRDRYRVSPGLYALGEPKAEAPVIVTANYKLTFDMVRRNVAGLDAWLLVLDTHGINVWCAAGKGTFGTREVIQQVRRTRLAEVVSHRTLIVPQLGAVGVAAHEVRKDSGFKVIYGPVRAADLPSFVRRDFEATAEMRQVTFGLKDRLVLTPVELTAFERKTLWAALLLFVLGGIGPNVFSVARAWSRGSGAVVVGAAALATGAILTPILLPWLPGKAFALKGAIAGVAVSLIGLVFFRLHLDTASSLALVLSLPAAASFVAMNFTGSTTFTSPSGVEREMRRAIPLQAFALLAAAVIWIGGAF